MHFLRRNGKAKKYITKFAKTLNRFLRCFKIFVEKMLRNTFDPESQAGLGVEPEPIHTTFSNLVGGRDPPSLLLLDTLLRPLFLLPDLN